MQFFGTPSRWPRAWFLYNRIFVKQLTFIITLLPAVAGLISCGGPSTNLNTKDAVRAAVVEHLSARKGLDLDMGAMELDIGDVSFRANEAEASVSFRPKGTQASAMTMKYALVRDGNRWKVKPKAPESGGANPHGAIVQPQPGTGPGGQAVMPPGHPPLGAKK